MSPAALRVARRFLALAFAAAPLALLAACAGPPALSSSDARTELQTLQATVERTRLQFNRAAGALADVGDDWDTDPDRSIAGFSREIAALESRVREAAAPGDDRILAAWNERLRAARAVELAAAPDDAAPGADRALGRAEDLLADLQESLSPVFSRFLDLKAAFVIDSSIETVEDHLTEIRRAVGSSRETTRRFDRLAEQLELLSREPRG
ncbi:MAG: hypothetical protein IBJ10_11230 [Phycisphaerales bacterium]|nr:hypothetical protein [Phycisphaerales bacterium]